MTQTDLRTADLNQLVRVCVDEQGSSCHHGSGEKKTCKAIKCQPDNVLMLKPYELLKIAR